MTYNKDLSIAITKIGRDTLRKILVEWDNYQYKMGVVCKDARHDDFMDVLTTENTDPVPDDDLKERLMNRLDAVIDDLQENRNKYDQGNISLREYEILRLRERIYELDNKPKEDEKN